MTDLTTDFEKAAQEVQTLTSRPNNDVLLKLYGFYKQATRGDVQGKRPGMLDMAGRAKYDAWAALRGMDRESAMQDYINLVESLK